MKNLKKLLAVIVAVCVLATMAIPAFAAETTPTDAEICEQLGVLKGDGAGVTDAYLAKGTERYQAAILYLRLLGLEAEAAAFDGEENFDDADLIYAGGQKILAYLKANPDLGWVGVGGNKFDPKGAASAQMIYKVLLEALGYEYGTDFTWADTIDFAATVGLSKIADATELTNADLATALVEALKADVKGGEQTLAEKLIEDGIIDEEDAIEVGLVAAAPAALAVASVTAINAKQVAVVFNKDMNKDSLTTANFEVYDSGSTSKTIKDPALQSDNKTVILTIDGNDKLTNASKAKVIVKKDVKAADGVTLGADYTNTEVVVQDTVMPAIERIEPAGLKTLKIYFTEPVYDGTDDDIATNQITIKSGIYTYVVTGIKADYVEKSLTVTVGTNLIEGNLEITVNAQGMADTGAIRDFAGLVALKTVNNYTYAPDNTVATVTLESVNKATGKAKVKFSKMVYGTNVKLYHSVNGEAAYGTASVSKTIDQAATEWEFTFTNAIPSGTLTFYLVNDSAASNQLTDLYGVKVPNQTFTYTVVADTTPPTVSEVKVNANTSFDVVFSEEVKASEVKADNFEILKADGSKVSFGIALQSDGKTVRLSASLEDGATYTINVKAMQDVAGNAMAAAYSVQKTIGDNTHPSVSGKYIVGTNTIYIVYSEAMNEADIGNKANYLVDKTGSGSSFVALGDNDSVTVVTNKKVKITINSNDLVAGATDVQIGPVRDLAGKRLGDDATFQTLVSNIPGDTLGIYDAQLIAKNKIKVIFTNELGAFDPGEIGVRQEDTNLAASPALAFTSVESNVVNSDGRTEIVLVLDNDVKYNAVDTSGEALEVYSKSTTANTKSLEGTVLGTNLEKIIADKLAPAVDTVIFVNANQIKVKFTEELDHQTFAAVGKNGFSVAGGTLNSAQIDTDRTIVILSGSDFTINTDVSYNGTNGITDKNSNALAAFTYTDTLDTP